ncbi:hypothetical protein, partial [Pseudomonas helleri]|uniref:hypothetical protein n=1 Tax=Pseudomonas helleri TaxID=1608996 RepID=UPI001E2919E6
QCFPLEELKCRTLWKGPNQQPFPNTLQKSSAVGSSKKSLWRKNSLIQASENTMAISKKQRCIFETFVIQNARCPETRAATFSGRGVTPHRR